jgi:hypothetical protein
MQTDEHDDEAQWQLGEDLAVAMATGLDTIARETIKDRQLRADYLASAIATAVATFLTDNLPPEGALLASQKISESLVLCTRTGIIYDREIGNDA